MALNIKRSADERVIKAIVHRVADISGGVTVSVADLGGLALKEGTPLAYVAADAMYHVCKTAVIVTAATDSAVDYEVEKGHHFKVGDRFGTEASNGHVITAIDKTTNTDKDVITVGTTLGAVTAAGVVAYETSGANKTVRRVPTAIAGSNYDVVANESLFCDAWVIAVVKKGVGPQINDTLAATLKGIHYIV